MVRITIDEELQKKLLSSGEVVELFDESGELLGRVFPESVSTRGDGEPMFPEPTEEELNQAAEYDGPAITTAELLARLRTKQ